jgi:hypothetical protein
VGERREIEDRYPVSPGHVSLRRLPTLVRCTGDRGGCLSLTLAHQIDQ